MTVIALIILGILGTSYVLASEGAMFEYVVPDQDDYDSKLESKRIIKAILLIPVALLIGPYYIYKVLKGGNKE